MTFNPGTKQWAEAALTVSPRGEASKFVVYDPRTDAIIRFYYNGARGLTSQVIDLTTGQTAETVHRGDANGKRVNDARLGQEYAGIDVEGRRVWLIEPVHGRLYRYDIDLRRLAYEADTPVKNPTGGSHWPWDSAMPVWDLVNRVLLWPHIPSYSRPTVTLFIYYPDRRAWEQDAPAQVDGRPITGNVAVFDPVQNALLVMGRGSDRVFLYRYGP